MLWGFKVMTTYMRKCQNFLKTFLLPSLLCSVGMLGFSLWAGSSLSVGDVANLMVAENQFPTRSPGADIPDRNKQTKITPKPSKNRTKRLGVPELSSSKSFLWATCSF